MNQHLDVAQMQADLAAQAAQPMYDMQANQTDLRASYGDIPAMMMSGAGYAGAVGMGAAQGMGNMFSALGSKVLPLSYTPPARVSVGYYGQYQQPTGFFSNLLGYAGLTGAPRGANAYMHGYYQAADLGERVGGGLVSAANVLGATAAFGAGAAIGAPIGSSVGAGILGPLGMKAGGVIGSLGVGMLAYQGVAELGEMVAQRRQMNAFLESSSFRYVGAGSSMADQRLGTGMSASARRSATDFIRQMDIGDASMNTEDLFGVLQGGTSLGLFQGTRDMDDFKRKFKDIVEGVKVVSKTLNTSLQEGLQVMKDFKSIAVDPSQMGTYMAQARTAGMVSGRTGMEVVNLGLQGAELYRGTGIEMKVGYQSNVMNIAAIRAARDAGTLSQEAISQAGGEEAFAQRLTASGLGFMQSAAGRGFLAQNFMQGAGPGGFDRNNFMQSMMSGDTSFVGSITQGMQRLGTPGAVISYGANQDKFMSEAGKAFGGDTSIMATKAIMQQAKWMQQSVPGLNEQDAFKYVAMESYGRTPQEADLLYGRIAGAQNEFNKKTEGAAIAASQQRYDEARSTVGLGYAARRVSDFFKGVSEPAVVAGESAIESVREGLISFRDKQIMGITSMDVRQSSYSLIAAQHGSDKSYHPVRLPALDLDKGIFSGSILGTSLGRQIRENIIGLEGGVGKSIIRKVVTPGEGDIILGTSSSTTPGGASVGGVMYDVVSGEDYKAFGDKVAVPAITEAEIAKMEKEGGLAKTKATMFGAIAANKASSYRDLAEYYFNKSPEDLTRGERGRIKRDALAIEVEGQKGPIEVVKDQESKAENFKAQQEGVSISRVAQLEEAQKSIASEASKVLGVEISPAIMDLLTLSKNAKTEEEATKYREQAVLLKKKEDSKGFFGRYTGKNVGELDTLFKNFVSAKSREDLFVQNTSAAVDLNELMKARGGELFSNIVSMETSEGRLTSTESALVQKSVQDIILKGAKVYDLLDEKSTAAMSKSVVGRTLLEGKDVISKMDQVEEEIKEAEKKGPVSSLDRKAIFNKHFNEDLKIAEGTKKKMEDALQSSPEAARKIYMDTLVDQAGKVGKAGAGASISATDESAGTAQGQAIAQFDQQMKINLEILTAFRSMNQGR